MQVTSASLFHFTKSLSSLEKILSNRFQLTYCREKYYLDYEIHESYYPLVSFCDIPLSLAQPQIKKYGKYAIGLSKDWGIRNRLNPVVYVEKGSLLAKDIQSSVDTTVKLIETLKSQIDKNKAFSKEISTEFDEEIKKAEIKLEEGKQSNAFDAKTFKKDLEENLLPKIRNYQKHLLKHISSISDHNELLDSITANVDNDSNLFRYIKNYSGPLERKRKSFAEYRFYDEREWRYTPEINDKRLKCSLTQIEYDKYRGSTSNIKPFIPGVKLDFQAEDINYLLVRSSKDISKLIKALRKMASLTSSPEEIDILSTKVLTVEQIRGDF